VFALSKRSGPFRGGGGEGHWGQFAPAPQFKGDPRIFKIKTNNFERFLLLIKYDLLKPKIATIFTKVALSAFTRRQNKHIRYAEQQVTMDVPNPISNGMDALKQFMSTGWQSQCGQCQ
jgi:hypothetical protein